jgi:ABC-type glycerol-3-phosphate transport system substrate-binding protein
MTAASKQTAATWLWIKFITDQESGIRLGEIGGVPGARPDAYGSPRLQKDPVWKVFQDAMQVAQPARIPYNARMQEYARAIADGTKPLWDGTTTPNAAFFAEWSRTLQVILDMPLP